MRNIVIDRFKVLEFMGKKHIKNLSELSKALGISKNQLSNILSNKFKPIKSNVMELAEFLEINPIELLKIEEETKEKK